VYFVPRDKKVVGVFVRFHCAASLMDNKEGFVSSNYLVGLINFNLGFIFLISQNFAYQLELNSNHLLNKW
jgi:hypothetical protein